MHNNGPDAIRTAEFSAQHLTLQSGRAARQTIVKKFEASHNVLPLFIIKKITYSALTRMRELKLTLYGSNRAVVDCIRWSLTSD